DHRALGESVLDAERHPQPHAEPAVAGLEEASRLQAIEQPHHVQPMGDRLVDEDRVGRHELVQLVPDPAVIYRFLLAGRTGLRAQLVAPFFMPAAPALDGRLAGAWRIYVFQLLDESWKRSGEPA